MTTIYKVLGQTAPAAITNTTLYTVPASTSAVISTLNVCNQATTAATFRVAIRPQDATISNQHYILFDTPVPGNDSIAITIGITLAATDVITVYSSNNNLSFNLFGSEVS